MTMKKMILILTLAAVCSFAFSQRTAWVDSLAPGDIVGADTVVWYRTGIAFPQFGGQWSIDVIYTDLDDDDATISIGGNNQGTGYNALDDSAFPYTLDATTDTQTINGVASAVKTFYGYYYPFTTLGVYIDPGSVTSGKIYWKYLQQ